MSMHRERRTAIGICFVVACVLTGCRSGTSSLAAPSWWSFGGSGADPSKLASAPPFESTPSDGKIQKPSQSATPYPTTTTPNGYAVADATKASPTETAPPAIAASEPAAVTYGSTPPAPPAPQYPSTAAAGSSLSSINPRIDSPPGSSPQPGSPQVGPYASLPAASSPPATPAPSAPAMPPMAPISQIGRAHV